MTPLTLFIGVHPCQVQSQLQDSIPLLYVDQDPQGEL